ncbi:MAG TPA: proteasome accessory factor PafA2 family protein [Streptosporangiaceae bacterium]|nr:proteasome accessory factor PafA2 family protein [Streptosporangiaceae bacterium]
MDARGFGLRDDYSIVCAFGGQRQLSAEEVGRYLFGPVVPEGRASSVLLRNGGRLHLGAVSGPEYATPECGSALDLIVWAKAGERIVEGLLADAGRRLREEGVVGDIHVFKSSAGRANGSFGCQENYLVGRRGEFGRLADILIPFLVTRQLICGAGAVMQAPRGTVYCLSRLAGRTRNGVSPAATRSRPIINTRDEPRAAAAGLRRLRVVVSDSNMSETTTLLKVGATDLVLRMAEAGTVLPDLTLDNPIQAIGEVSRDITGRSRVRLAGGRQMSALDIQREYLAKARDFTGKHGADAVSSRVLGAWERALDAIGAGNPGIIAREIDWVIKYRLIEQYRARHDLPLSAPQVAQADLAYHDIDRRQGLYYQLQRSNKVDRTARDIGIFEAKSTPPVPGRYRQAG